MLWTWFVLVQEGESTGSQLHRKIGCVMEDGRTVGKKVDAEREPAQCLRSSSLPNLLGQQNTQCTHQHLEGMHIGSLALAASELLSFLCLPPVAMIECSIEVIPIGRRMCTWRAVENRVVSDVACC